MKVKTRAFYAFLMRMHRTRVPGSLQLHYVILRTLIGRISKSSVASELTWLVAVWRLTRSE
jgi:hypothetical protein